MNNKKTDVAKLAQMGLFTAIMIFMSFTPLGYIPLGFMNATTMHIPVIIGACIMGPKMGAVLGFIFGITSVVKATITPIVTSFVFSPFYSVGEFSGSWKSLIVAIVPRILIGIFAGICFNIIKNKVRKKAIALAIAGFTGSLVNTVGVMCLIYLLFGDMYALAIGKSSSYLLIFIFSVIGINGIPEAIIAAIVTAAVGSALLVVMGNVKKKKTKNPQDNETKNADTSVDENSI